MNGPDPAREAAILARCEVATKGPWEWEEFQLEDDRNSSALIHDSVGVLYHQACWRVRDADAAFIAHAREDVPWLLAQLAAARARAERAEGALVEIRAEMPATCTCDAAYSGRHLADPSCGYHDYGALCLEIIDHALAARGE